MLDFKTLTLKDKSWVDKIVMAEDSPSADYNFTNMYIWDKHYRQLICPFEGRLMTKVRYEGRPFFVYPIGSGPIRPAIDMLKACADEDGVHFRMRGITEEHKKILEQEYPGKFKFRELTDCNDYIYLAGKLATYSGKALHGKKNHCNRFEKEHDWEFVPLSRELIPHCLDMLDTWLEDNSERLDDSVRFEHDAVIRAFAAFEQLRPEGGVLLSEGKILGFTLGTMANSDTFDVHFEKADININGAYPMVCRELCRMLMEKHPNLKYINREDDMGLESLRRSKESYKPEYMLRKYTARWIDE